MLHEVLLSLWGCSTSINEILEIDMSELQKYMHPGECDVIANILSVVQECNKIRHFINSYSIINNDLSYVNENEKYKHGMYIRALCNGMDEVLQPFRDEVMDLEKLVLNDAYVPATLIYYRVQKYTCLFSNLNSIIKSIETQNLYGCKLLQCLHERTRTGIPEVKVALEKLMYYLHIVFYKQLTSWLLYSRLEDPFKEFFIQKSEETTSALSSFKETSSFHSDYVSVSGDNKMWEYDIQLDMLPSYIRPTLASKILTIGQTVIMFRNDTRHKKDFSIEKKIELSIWGEKEKEYYQKLHRLQSKSVFVVSELERVIDELKRCVEEHLWVITMEEAQLIQQLKLLKEFYLMGRGDLYLEFIKLSSDILGKTPTNRTTSEINLAFQLALRKTSFNDEISTDCFSFHVTVPPADTEVQHKSDSDEISEREREDPIEKRGWGLITLKYKVNWPLHLLFSPKVLQDYNILFRFLLRVKKTQIELWNLWSHHMHLKEIDPSLLQLRNTLIFIIDNLQYYLQVDVLESQCTIMENKMKNTRNFEDVQQAHCVFLVNVLSQMFLLDRSADKQQQNPVAKLLCVLLRLCDDLIKRASMWEVRKLPDEQKDELKLLSDTLNSLMGWLTKTLNKVRAQSSGDHLAQLLLRLDFNRWFSNKVTNIS